MRIEIIIYNDLNKKLETGDWIEVNGNDGVFMEANNNGIYYMREGKQRFINYKQIKILI